MCSVVFIRLVLYCSILGYSSGFQSNLRELSYGSTFGLPENRLSKSIQSTQRSPWNSVSKLSESTSLEPSKDVASIISTTLSSELPYISIGDIVRYYDLDGGKEKGQILVGKATFVYQKTVSDLDKGSIGDPEWIVEIEEFEDIGQGYFSEYSSRKSKHVVRNLKDLAPVIATYVRSADAYKIPFAVNSVTGNKEPLVSYENYRLDGFDVPKRKIVVNQQMLDNDMENYLKLKGDLLRDACVAGLIGALLVEFFRGTEDAVCYSLGAAAGVAYLFFLTLKVRILSRSILGEHKQNYSMIRTVHACFII